MATQSDVTYGLIGIGNMGYGMATNLRKNIPKDSKLIICELDKPRLEKFVSETQGLIETAETPKELCDKAVCRCMLLQK